MMDTEFAATLRELRREHGMSLRVLAKAAFSSKSQVHALESGTRRPTLEQARHLDAALGAGGVLTNAVMAQPTPDVGGESGDAEADRARATTRHLVALDTMHGSDGLVSVADRAFRGFADHMAVSGASKELRSAVADLGAAAAWIAADATERNRSRALALESLVLADMAGDLRMRRFLLSHLSMVSEHAGRYGDALAFAEQILADQPRSPRVRAMIQVRRSRALSGLGAHSPALDAWEHAAHLLTESPSADDGLTYWIHDAEMAVHRAVILSRAGSHEAIDWGHRGVEGLPGGQGRDRVLFRAMLLEQAVTANAWSEISTITTDLMRFAGQRQSARVPEAVGAAWASITGIGAPPAARDLVRAAFEAWQL